MPGNAVTVTAEFEYDDITPPDSTIPPPPPTNTEFTDVRDNKQYKTVKIGDQTWMAENMNYQTASGSRCYGEGGTVCGDELCSDEHERTLSSAEIQANCNTYGRLYNWDAAMTACPSGWHLPTLREWGDLVIFAGGTGEYSVTFDSAGYSEYQSGTAGMKLKSTSGWNWRYYEDPSISANGTDDFGFSALPGGEFDAIYSRFRNVGGYCAWWTATAEYNINGNIYAYYRQIDNSHHYMGDVPYYPVDGGVYISDGAGFSVRCIAD
jgi:uncharacterized protein (TIGR02145 family)